MKKIFLILAVMMLLGIAASNFLPVPSQAGILLSPDARLKSEVFAGSTLPQVSTTITSSNRILGYKLTGTASNTAGLYDASSTGALTNSTIFDEGGIDGSGANDTQWYPAPKNLSNGLGVMRSASTCTLTVYYE